MCEKSFRSRLVESAANALREQLAELEALNTKLNEIAERGLTDDEARREMRRWYLLSRAKGRRLLSYALGSTSGQAVLHHEHGARWPRASSQDTRLLIGGALALPLMNALLSHIDDRANRAMEN